MKCYHNLGTAKVPVPIYIYNFYCWFSEPRQLQETYGTENLTTTNPNGNFKIYNLFITKQFSTIQKNSPLAKLKMNLSVFYTKQKNKHNVYKAMS